MLSLLTNSCRRYTSVCGTSDNPCSDTYSGPGAASEVETQQIVDAVLERQNNEGGIEIFISIHTYAQFWLIPWGGTPVKPDDYNDLVRARLRVMISR